MNCEPLQGWHCPPGATDTIPLAVWDEDLDQRRRQSIPLEVRQRIYCRAARATPRQLGDVIAAALVQSDLDWKRIPLEEMKGLVLEAVLASQRATA